MANLERVTCTPFELVKESPCFQCVSDTELIAAIALLSYALNHSGAHDIKDMIKEGKCFSCLSDHQMLEAITAVLVDMVIADQYFDDAADAMHAAECLSCTDPAIVRGIIVAEMCTLIQNNIRLL